MGNSNSTVPAQGRQQTGCLVAVDQGLLKTYYTILEYVTSRIASTPIATNLFDEDRNVLPTAPHLIDVRDGGEDVQHPEEDAIQNANDFDFLPYDAMDENNYPRLHCETTLQTTAW